MSTAARCGVACLVVGCGRIGFDARQDGQVGDTTDIDMAIDAGPSVCELAWLGGTPTLAAPTLLTGLMTAAEERDPFLSRDGLTLWFTSGDDIFVSSRASVAATFDAAAIEPTLSSVVKDYRITFRNDGLELFAAREAGAGIDIFTATRASTTDSFGAFVPVPGLASTAVVELDPELADDGLTLYFAPNPGDQDLAFTKRASLQSAFGGIQTITELSTTQTESDPALLPSERVIVFSRNAGGAEFDLRFATRATATSVFGADQLVPTVNAADVDGDPTLSTDGCEMYFTSRRTGNFELYVTHVIP